MPIPDAGRAAARQEAERGRALAARFRRLALQAAVLHGWRHAARLSAMQRRRVALAGVALAGVRAVAALARWRARAGRMRRARAAAAHVQRERDARMYGTVMVQWQGLAARRALARRVLARLVSVAEERYHDHETRYSQQFALALRSFDAWRRWTRFREAARALQRKVRAARHALCVGMPTDAAPVP